MATVDIDMTLPINEITEPVIITLSIEEARNVMHTRELPDDAYEDVVAFLEEYDAHGY